ncbi:MAG TPA: energy-coupling factor transporter ATPase [Candidatus Faeciplasma avium]|uniref:Energy-coupling factor transporter ATP-binding protein EcfA2 n=1 Tax=Candidatus Faeciplasma avium TaxID=2840798 RepID=A0A9D1NRN4_9FIRM|nr:energy-coupling factor transporter ATPase [Candidatus Faeciplasma avium]
MGIIKTQDLSYVYGEGTPFRKVALDKVNIDIEEGELVGIIGRTGSGKSTLIQHFNGLLKATSGKVFIDGEELFSDKSRLRQIRFKVGLVFQYPEYQLFEDTVYKDIAYGPINMGLGREEVDERVKRTMSLVGLKPELMQKSPFELSGGQKRRVAIAGVMAMEPKVLILDEPTAGLDPHGRDRILNLIKEYHRQKGSTVMLVSHSMEDIAKTVNKILVMNDSRLFMYDTPERVFAKVKELDNMGLTVPQITRVFDRLRDSGIAFSDEVYSVDYAKKLVLRLLQEKRVRS